MRSVWYIENAVSTVFTAAAMPVSAVHVVVVVVAVFGVAGALVGVVGVADGECVGEAVGEALAEAEADGRARAWVRVIVVTFPAVATVAVTRAPVVPTSRIPANTPDFACSKSSRSRSSI